MTDWRKSSRSMGNGNCTEVKPVTDRQVVAQYAKSRRDAPSEVFNAACRLLEQPTPPADPGDLPARMAAAILQVRFGDEMPSASQLIDAARDAAAAMSVRWEGHAATVAKLDHALAELSSLRDHRARWQTEKARADKAEAERDLLRETLAESDLGAQVLAQWEAIAASDADRDRLEAEVERLRAELAEVKVDNKGLRDRLYYANADATRAEAERDAAVNVANNSFNDAVQLHRATRNAMDAYRTHRKQHPHPQADCDACVIGVTLSRDLPRIPDTREEIAARLNAYKAAKKPAEGHGDARNPQTQGAHEGEGVSGAPGGSQ